MFFLYNDKSLIDSFAWDGPRYSHLCKFAAGAVCCPGLLCCGLFRIPVLQMHQIRRYGIVYLFERMHADACGCIVHLLCATWTWETPDREGRVRE